MARRTPALYESLADFISGHVQENLHRELTIEELADKTGVSRFHLNRLFQATTGFQLGEFIQRRRLQQAHALLRAGHSVTAASLAVGYESHSAFSRAFLKAFGCAPSAVRAGDACEWRTPNTLKHPCLRDAALQPQWVELPERRFCGHYGAGFSDNSFVRLASELSRQLLLSVDARGLPGLPSSPIGVSLESPWQGDQAQSRFFMGVDSRDLPDTNGLDTYVWTSGAWATFHHVGPYELMWQTISRIYAGWVIPEGIALRDDSIVQRYRNDPRTTAGPQRVTELYFPVLA